MPDRSRCGKPIELVRKPSRHLLAPEPCGPLHLANAPVVVEDFAEQNEFCSPMRRDFPDRLD